jgi:DNA polymerase-1
MKTLLVDGNNLAMRSFHAAHGAMTSGGQETGSLQIFVTTLAKHIREENPSHLVVCWDSGDCTRRLALYPKYKAARRAKQAGQGDPHRLLFQLIHSFLAKANIAQWAAEGIEADDLIATGWLRSSEKGKVVILSADKDLLQLLIDNDTEVVRFATGGAERWDRRRFIEERGFRPEQLPLIMALEGDSSDGVPGMPRVGPVKALKMLQAANWDLDKAMEPYPEHRDIVMTSKKLVDLLDEVFAPLPAVPVFRPATPADQRQSWSELLDFCTLYELRMIRQRLIAGDLWAA